MSLRNFHVDSNITDSDLLKRSDGLFKNFVASFRQAAANGHFSFGGITLQDHDLNRVHGIVTEIDSRRLFYACGEDESPHYAMQSLYEARRSIVNASKGVWANPSCEVLVQEITATLSQYCTEAEKLAAKSGDMWSVDQRAFMMVMTDMRLSIWLLVAALQRKLGSIIRPRNLPTDIVRLVNTGEV
ncbi:MULTISPECIES: hypothetical protein [Rhodanobacter]|uniref:hypothetical protein n=1 Tax=Rhodanobacter TaxID=75309 RepID=UPI0005675F41|nr:MULTISPECIES: hypothetical protein [Rhodanobacter]KZC19445.1 hypothetical protein RHOFW104R3_31240 [Rhodanobacter denitrificans]UJJ50012.1 hypothetical protein LRK52_12325 [Rhodanobacter denitrificans]UJM92726.1 hypothetical protein LRK32_12235 [Rhodanobacter denitrificans]UJM96256.1 hypothetical protein LRK44_12240 [Rhodanobacter denitrificans]UJN20913.1 hypothetical protein LRK54_14400 [Rhodanobacter denitrificans]